MPSATPTPNSRLEQRSLAALRAMEPRKQAEMLLVLDAMAKAFPARRPVSLTLAATNDSPAQSAHAPAACRLIKGGRS